MLYLPWRKLPDQTPLIRPSPEVAEKFKRGYLFEYGPEDIRIAKKMVQDYRDNEKGKSITWTWTLTKTPLKYYACQERGSGRGLEKTGYLDVEKHLAGQIKKAVQEGRKLAILDVGGGTLEQWKGLLKRYGKHIEFWSTTLTDDYTHPEMKKYSIQCTADELHLNFMPNYFDFVFTHYGSHIQARELIEDAVWVMKSGGEGIFCGRSYTPPEPERPVSTPVNYSAYYEIMHEDARKKDNTHPVNPRQDSNVHWTYHIKKK